MEGGEAIHHIIFGNDGTAKKYGIRNMPDTFLIDRHGRIAATYVGFVNKDDLDINIQSVLSQPYEK